MNKNIFLIILVVAVVLVGAWLWMQKGAVPSSAPATNTQVQTQATQPSITDTTQSINTSLNSIDTGVTLDQQFQGIDASINQL